MNSINQISPFSLFRGVAKQWLESGRLFVGVAGRSAEKSPIKTYASVSISGVFSNEIPQPIEVRNGITFFGGNPTNVYVDAADYSFLLQTVDGIDVVKSANRTFRFDRPRFNSLRLIGEYSCDGTSSTTTGYRQVIDLISKGPGFYSLQRAIYGFYTGAPGGYNSFSWSFVVMPLYGMNPVTFEFDLSNINNMWRNLQYCSTVTFGTNEANRISKWFLYRLG